MVEPFGSRRAKVQSQMKLFMIRDELALSRALSNLVALDERLGPLAAKVSPLPLRHATPGFAALARIIVAQQVSAVAAEKIYLRLERTIGEVTPENYLEAGPDAWKEGGLSRPKQKTIAAAAEAVMSGQLDLEALCQMEAEVAIAAMIEIWGIGRWTAEVYLLFAGGHPDVFPARDLALQIALQECFGLDARPSEAETIAFTAAWSPYRSIAARLMWTVYGFHRNMAAPLPA
ncbi:MAG: DNA-3-methyladenine glycosylase family protein [Notoacmeibacter sp.]